MKGITAVLLAIAFLPIAAAHGPPQPSDDHIHRVLEDHNDDCGGDGITTNCGGTHDLLALDIVERWDAALKANVLVFRLILSPGEGGRLQDTITFNAAGATKALKVVTTNGETFTGDFERFEGPELVNDGERFRIDGIVKLSTLGLAPGAKMEGFKVEATRDGKAGDYMPGGYVTPLGTRVEDPPQGSEPTDYGPVAHDVVGPTKYAALVLPASAQAGSSASTIDVKATNLLRRTAQSVTLSVEAPVGIQASFEGSTTKTIDVAKASQAVAKLTIQGTSAGTVRIIADTDLGGRVVKDIPVTIATNPSNPTPEGGDGGRDAPAPGIALTAVLALLALLRRRA